MNCPSCDLQTLPGQKFCRSCGASLQMTTQPLAGSGTVSELDKPLANNSRGAQQRANGLVLWGFISMFVGVAISLIGKMLMHQDIVTVVGVLITLAGMFLTAYPYLSPARPHKDDSAPSTQPDVLTQSPATKFLPQGGHIESLPSITERTTDLLMNPAPNRTRKKEDEES
jgi:predicted lipid-binding transport protein (Tim44 family)